MSTDIYHERYRPQFHFSARNGWLNDPNGLVYYKGTYHLFFQHNPFGTVWGNMTWGHAVSRDLMHWQQLDNALLPDEMGTMYSGSAVVDWDNTAGLQSGTEKTIIALYTAAGGTSPESQDKPFTQCLAYSTDGGQTLVKYAANPVLPNIASENRDPKVIWFVQGKFWVMALYLDGSAFGLFRSFNLRTWEQLQTIEMPGCSECPDFFPLSIQGEAGESRWVLTAANGKYLVGTFDGHQFMPDTTEPRQVDFGANYYAVQTYSDAPDGRRMQIGWMSGGQFPDMPFNQQMSIPCELTLVRTEFGLCLTRIPVNELITLYTAGKVWHSFALATEPTVLSARDLLDIELDCEVSGEGKVVFDIRGEQLMFDAAHATLSCLGKSAPIPASDGHLKLRVLVDRASIEVFANGGLVSMTSSFTPDAAHAQTTLSGADATVTALIVHELRSAWE